MMPEDMSLTVEEVLRRARRDASEAKERAEQAGEHLQRVRADAQRAAADFAKGALALESKVAELESSLATLLGPTTEALEERYLDLVGERLAHGADHEAALAAGRQLVYAAVGFPRLKQAVVDELRQAVGR